MVEGDKFSKMLRHTPLVRKALSGTPSQQANRAIAVMLNGQKRSIEYDKTASRWWPFLASTLAIGI